MVSTAFWHPQLSFWLQQSQSNSTSLSAQDAFPPTVSLCAFVFILPK